MRVSELARQAGVTPDTVRHYTRIGVLSPGRDPHNGYRHFSGGDLARLEFIRNARALGLSVAEIRDVLAASERGSSPCPMVRELVSHHLTEVRAQIEALTRLRDRMTDALARWDRMPDGVPDGHHVCALIESWAAQTERGTRP